MLRTLSLLFSFGIIAAGCRSQPWDMATPPIDMARSATVDAHADMAQSAVDCTQPIRVYNLQKNIYEDRLVGGYPVFDTLIPGVIGASEPILYTGFVGAADGPGCHPIYLRHTSYSITAHPLSSLGSGTIEYRVFDQKTGEMQWVGGGPDTNVFMWSGNRYLNTTENELAIVNARGQAPSGVTTCVGGADWVTWTVEGEDGEELAMDAPTNECWTTH